MVCLHKTSIQLANGIRILGTTLWSHVRPKSVATVEAHLSDYTSIMAEEGERGRTITAADTNAWHQEELEWLQGELETARCRGESCVVMTHHAPTRNDISTFPDTATTDGTNIHLTHLLMRSPFCCC